MLPRNERFMGAAYGGTPGMMSKQTSLSALLCIAATAAMTLAVMAREPAGSSAGNGAPAHGSLIRVLLAV